MEPRRAADPDHPEPGAEHGPRGEDRCVARRGDDQQVRDRVRASGELAVGRADDERDGELELDPYPTRQIPLQPTRHAGRERRHDDLVDLPLRQHVLDRICRVFVTDLSLCLDADPGEELEPWEPSSWPGY